MTKPIYMKYTFGAIDLVHTQPGGSGKGQKTACILNQWPLLFNRPLNPYSEVWDWIGIFVDGSDKF